MNTKIEKTNSSWHIIFPVEENILLVPHSWKRTLTLLKTKRRKHTRTEALAKHVSKLLLQALGSGLLEVRVANIPVCLPPSPRQGLRSTCASSKSILNGFRLQACIERVANILVCLPPQKSSFSY